ncbi:MAG: aminotransferase class V-fold PLP-dependent enzyme [Bacillota bacterium]
MIYFNNAATTWPKPEKVYSSMDSFFRNMGMNPGRSGASEVMDTARTVYDIREKTAEFFSIKSSDHLVFNSGSTESLNTVIKGVLKAGDHVIITNMEHNSVIRPLQRLKKDIGIEISYVSLKRNSGDLNYKELQSLIKKNTRLVAVSHASNVIGTVVDIDRIVKIISNEDILFLLDSAQTAGVIPIDVNNPKIDFLAVPGHKSLFGPPGIGALYIRDPESLSPLKEGGTGTNSLNTCQPDVMPDRFEAGTVNTVGIVGLGAGIDFINKTGIKNIHRKEMDLTEKLLKGLNSIPEVKIYGKIKREGRLSVVAFNIADMASHELAYILQNEYNIQVRSGLHCAPLLHKNLGTDKQGMVRVSIGYFNEEAEVDILLNIIDNIVKKESG